MIAKPGSAVIMKNVPYNFCLRVVECLPFSYELKVSDKHWQKAINSAPFGIIIDVRLVCMETGIWMYAICDQDDKALTIQELTKKPNLKDFRLGHLVILTDIAYAEDLSLEPLDRPLGAFLNILHFLSCQISLKIDAPTPLKPADQVTILEHLETIRFYNICISTFTAAYHNLIKSHVDNRLLRRFKDLNLSSEHISSTSL